MNSKRRCLVSLLIVVLACLVSTTVKAEDSRIVNGVYVPVSAVSTNANGTWTLTLGWGREQGLIQGSRGNAYHPAHDIIKPDGKKEAVGTERVGFVEIRSLDKNSATAILTSDSGKAPAIDDLVQVPARIPADVYDGVVLKLALLAAQFRIKFSTDEQLVISIDKALAIHSEAEEKALLEKVVADLHATAEYTDELKSEKGSYIGPVRPVMDNATVADVRDFLDFVAEFTSKYQGRTYNIAEAFATWVMYGKPPGPEYILRHAREINDEQLAVYLAKLQEEGNFPRAAVEDWEDSAVSDATVQSKDPNHYIRLLNASPKVIQDGSVAVAAQVALGMRTFMQGLWEKQKPHSGEIDKALQMAEQLPDKIAADGEEDHSRTYWKARVLKYRAWLFARVPDYPAAARDAIEAFELVKDANTQNRHLIALGAAEAAGDSLLKTGDFDAAARYYELAFQHARKLLGFGALRAESEMKNHLAQIAMERGDPATAIQRRKEALDLAREYNYSDLIYTYEWALGGDLYDSGKYDEAATHYSPLLKQAESKKDKSDTVNLLRNLGLCEGNRGRTKQADENFLQSLAIAQHNNLSDLIPGVYTNWAAVASRSRRYSDAAKLYRNAIKLIDESKSPEPLAQSYADLGNSLIEAHEYKEAEDALTHAAAIYQKLGMQGRRTRVLVILSGIYSNSGRPQEAEKTLLEVIAGLRTARDLQGLSEALVQMSYLHSLRNELAHAKAASEEALKLAIEAGDPAIEELPIRQLTQYYSRMGETAKAESLIKDVISRARLRKDELKVAAYLYSLGGVYGDMGKGELMRQNYEAALAIFTSNNLSFWIARVETELAAVDSWDGKPEEARKRLARARELFQTEEDYLRNGGLLEARLFRRESNYRQSVEVLQKVDAIAVRTGDQVTHLDMLAQIALVQMDQREYELALPIWDEILKATGEDVLSRASALINRAETLVYLGHFAEADDSAKEAVALAEKYRLHWLPMIRAYRAKYLTMWARKTSDSKQAAARLDEATMLLNLAEPEARKDADIHSLLVAQSACVHRAVLIAEREDSLPVTVEPLPKADGTPWFADELVEIAAKLRTTEDLWEARFLRGALRNSRDDVDGAIDDLQASIAILEEQALQYAVLAEEKSSATVYQSDKERPFTTLLTVYDRKAQQLSAKAEQMARKATEAGDPALAKDFTDEEKATRAELAKVYAKAREVLDVMRKFQLLTSSAGLSVPGGSTELQAAAMRYQALFRQQQEIERRLEEEYKRTGGQVREEVIKLLEERLEQQHAQIEAETKLIREQYPELAKELELDVSDLTTFAQQRLNEDEALIEPVLVPGRLIVFVARNHNGQAAISSFSSNVESEQLATDLRNIWRAASSPNQEFAPENSTEPGTPAFIAAEMYDRLFAPAEPALAGVKTVLISATGSLRYVPFHVLLAPGPEHTRIFLNDRFNIVYLTRSGSLGGNGKAVTYSAAPIVAVANPDGSLPEADAEVSLIATLWHGVPGTPFELKSRQDATVKSVNTSLGRVLAQSRGANTIFHVATHGKAGTLPADSYLLFADERVRQDEISRKLMNAGRVSLAVLSGCETALGTLDERGAGVTGLAYEFQRMGVHTVLATLWKLDSDTGKEFMTDFYKRLSKGSSVGDAVRESRGVIRSNSKTSHPYYWAPFVLIGAWR